MNRLDVRLFGRLTVQCGDRSLGARDFGGIKPKQILEILLLSALVNAAAKLPRIAIEAPDDDSVIGRTTESQMLIGIYWGYVAMIEGLLERLKAVPGVVRVSPAGSVRRGASCTRSVSSASVFSVVTTRLPIVPPSL